MDNSKKLEAAQGWALAVIVALLAHAGFYRWLGSALWNDWSYFNSLSLVVRSSLLHYGVLPLQNPWVCGGLDIISNPQNRVFSPFMLSDLVLPLQAGNLFPLVVYSVLGFLGMAKLAQQFAAPTWAAWLAGALFVNANWFGLHFAEGHIPFGGMQLLPATLALGRKYHSRRHLFGLGLIWTWFLLDGAIYALIYSLLGLLTLAILGLMPRPELALLLKRPRWPLMALIAAVVLVSVTKVFPILLSIGDRLPELDFYVMPAPVLFAALFQPLQTSSLTVAANPTPWRFHEYGCYLSLLGGVLIALAMIVDRRFVQRNWRLFIGALLWLWVGSGWLQPLNPWNIFQRIPLINNAHVQSRVFILLYIFFVLLVVQAILIWRHMPRVVVMLATALVIESWVVRNYPYQILQAAPERLPQWELIPSKTIMATSELLQWTPAHYMGGNAGAAYCYEPSFQSARVLPWTHDDYKGEVYLKEGEGSVSLESYTPGDIRLKYDLTLPALIELNTNALFGWHLVAGKAEVLGHSRDLLRVRPLAPSGEIHLRYQPWYINWLIASYLIGLGLFIAVWYHTRRDS